ncbi:hypothetical protein EDB80DRAFT_686837 [Ilyonectria destructans]|nr:hypothetical protein EDB80DRAFT_686837 [Ilyonectria destructans]
MLAITKITPVQIQLMEPMLNQLFEQQRDDDEEYPHDGDSASKDCNRVLRRAAFRAFSGELVGEQSPTGRCRHHRRRDSPHHWSQLRRGFQRGPRSQQHRGRYRGPVQTHHRSWEEVQTFPDEIAGSIEEGIEQMDYATAARSAMEVWLLVGTEASTLGEKYLRNQTKLYDACQEDETVDAETKTKLYEHHKLQRHLSAEFHSKLKGFPRRS